MNQFDKTSAISHVPSLAIPAGLELGLNPLEPELEGNEMPLSEQEQRLLEEMERSLYHNDVDFVSTAGVTRLRPNYRSVVLGVLLAVAGIGALIAGVALQQLWLGVLGFIIMFAGVLIAITPGGSVRGGSGRASVDRPGTESRQRTGPRKGFMDRLNDRWDRRQDGQR